MSLKEPVSLTEPPIDHHANAAACHDKAAAQHREAARLLAAGETEKAGQCAKQAREFGVQALQHGSKSGKEIVAAARAAGAKSAIGVTAANKNANGGYAKIANA